MWCTIRTRKHWAANFALIGWNNYAVVNSVIAYAILSVVVVKEILELNTSASNLQI
jgi:hypothetical protein